MHTATPQPTARSGFDSRVDLLYRKEFQEGDRLSIAAGHFGILKKSISEKRNKHVRWLVSELFMFECLGSGTVYTLHWWARNG